jgi:S1-C subfamily serine protease
MAKPGILSGAFLISACALLLVAEACGRDGFFYAPVMPSLVEVIAEGGRLYSDRPKPVVLAGKGLMILRRYTGLKLSKAGVGIIVDARGYAVTNAHIISGLKQVTLVFHDGKRSRGNIEFKSPGHDLAIVSFRAEEALAPIVFADSASVRPGDKTFTVIPGDERPLRAGVVTGIDVNVPWKEKGLALKDLIETDTKLTVGDSGAPLLDQSGRLIGMTVSGFLISRSLSYAIPSNSVAAFRRYYFQEIRQEGG